jgi:hypothetical protein
MYRSCLSVKYDWLRFALGGEVDVCGKVQVDGDVPNSPTNQHLVVGTIYFGVPCPPSFVESRGNKFCHDALQLRTSKERNVDSIGEGSKERQKDMYGRGRSWAG